MHGKFVLKIINYPTRNIVTFQVEVPDLVERTNVRPKCVLESDMLQNYFRKHGKPARMLNLQDQKKLEDLYAIILRPDQQSAALSNILLFCELFVENIQDVRVTTMAGSTTRINEMWRTTGTPERMVTVLFFNSLKKKIHIFPFLTN